MTRSRDLAKGTFNDAVTVQGAFTSLGIDDNATSTAITIDASENVGIGSATMAAYTGAGASRLVVGNNSGGTNGISIVGASDAYSTLAFTATAGAGDGWDHAGLVQYSHIDESMRFFSNTDERMRIDSAGRVTMPYQPAFDAYHAATAYSSGTTPTSLDLNATRLNRGNHYDTTNDRFVAPVAGVYQFRYQTIINGAFVNAYVVMLRNGGTIGGTSTHTSPTNNWNHIITATIVALAANDYVQVVHTTNTPIHGDVYQSFSGYLIG